MGDVAIKLEKVSKFYKLYDSPRDRFKEALSPFGKVHHKKFHALKNINLDIKKGEIVGIVGKNGCGKSTLLKLIAGVLVPSAGQVMANGKISALLELGSGFNPEFTGLKNIFFYGTILGFSKEEMKEKLDEILAFADIGDFINQPIKTYSSGMKARLAFSVAIYVEPEILILDEVLAVGDMLFQRKCFSKMEEFFNSGKTIIYVSHDTSSISRLCTRAILLIHGQLVFDGSPKMVIAEYKRSLYQNGFIVNEDLKGSICTRDIKKAPVVSKDFDSGLVTEVIVKEDSADIKFYDYHIIDKKKERVNVLEVGEDYSYVYYVRVNKPYYKVHFGAGIRDKLGVPLSWMIDGGSKKNMEKDCVYKVIWNFTCRLHEGLYYTSAGLRDAQGALLRQELDAFVFKVEKNLFFNVGGILDSSWSCNVNKEFV